MNWYINILEIMAAFLAFKENSAVSPGSFGQNNCGNLYKSPRGTRVPVSKNTGADMLSWNGPSLEEWKSSSKPFAWLGAYSGKQRHFSPQVAPSAPMYKGSWVREDRCSILLVTPPWQNQPWFPGMIPLPIPLRRDLLSQVRGTILHPQVVEPPSMAAWREPSRLSIFFPASVQPRI